LVALYVHGLLSSSPEAVVDILQMPRSWRRSVLAAAARHRSSPSSREEFPDHASPEAGGAVEESS
jgi:hypothetical protein